MKKPNKSIIQLVVTHIFVAIITLYILLGLDTWNNYRIDQKLGNIIAVRFDLSDALLIRLKLSIFFLLALIPFFASLYYFYKKNKKNLKIEYIKAIFIPFLGAISFPVLMYFYAIIFDDMWRGIWSIEIFIANVVIYTVNEILLFINLKKINNHDTTAAHKKR